MCLVAYQLVLKLRKWVYGVYSRHFSLLAAQVATSVVVQVHVGDESVVDVLGVQVIAFSDAKPSLHVRVIISSSVYTPLGDIMFVNCDKFSREHAKQHS